MVSRRKNLNRAFVTSRRSVTQTRSWAEACQEILAWKDSISPTGCGFQIHPLLFASLFLASIPLQRFPDSTLLLLPLTPTDFPVYSCWGEVGGQSDLLCPDRG